MQNNEQNMTIYFFSVIESIYLDAFLSYHVGHERSRMKECRGLYIEGMFQADDLN